MENKHQIVHELYNVKLIIGNGFDLHCHLKTSYADYFLYDETKNAELGEWIENFHDKAIDYLKHTSNYNDSWVNLKNFDCFNVWDVLFYIVSSGNGEIVKWNWCNIEETIAECLSGKSNNYRINRFNFEIVYEILNGNNNFNQMKIDENAYIIAGFIYKKNNEKQFNSKKDFYYFLLNQLNSFELNFGQYIYAQHCDDSHSVFSSTIYNDEFKRESLETLEALCTLDNLTSVDTFNYDTPECEKIEEIVHNINGNIKSPIFGIDSDSFLAPDPRHIFTKTSRRLEFEMKHKEIEPLFNYENVIIFGCSLNKADYNYFFSIFDKLNITSENNDSKIVFAYSVYDNNKRKNICTALKENVFLLFQEYSKYIGISTYPTRLLELLMIQRKIIFFEIPFYNTTEPTYFKKSITSK